MRSDQSTHFTLLDYVPSCFSDKSAKIAKFFAWGVLQMLQKITPDTHPVSPSSTSGRNPKQIGSRRPISNRTLLLDVRVSAQIFRMGQYDRVYRNRV